MVESKLTFKDPFERLGNKVYGKRFVGREEYVSELQKYCTTQNISIVGLPRIGKTSLAYHSVIFQKENVISDKQICPIFFDTGICDSPQDFFKLLVEEVYNNLMEFIKDDKNKNKLRENYQILVDKEWSAPSIRNFFRNYVNKMPINIVIVFDEFDKVRKIDFHGTHWGLLRVIFDGDNTKCIITSKRSVRNLENWGNEPDSQPSDFYKSLGHIIHLKQFNEDDMTAYWQRLEPFFEEIGLAIDEKYKQEAEFYVGRHPYLLDVYNSFQYKCFEKNQQTEITSLRSKIKESFDLMLEILKVENKLDATTQVIESKLDVSKVNLLDAAVQAVVGPVYDLNEDQKDRLENYGFIKSIQMVEKRKILGSDFGYSYVDDTGKEYAYIAPSEYFTLYMKSKFANKPDFWPNWSATIGALRQLMVQFFIDNYGENWESEDFSTQPDAIRTAIDEMKNSLQKDINLGFTTSPLIEYLMEGNLCQIIYKQWDSFADVFFPLSEHNFYDRFEYLKAFRNHPVHVNDKYLSEENKQKADQYLEEIKKNLDIWLTKPDKQKLTIQQTQSLTSSSPTFTVRPLENDELVGEISQDRKEPVLHCIWTSSYSYPFKIKDALYVKSASNIGKKARFVVKKGIDNRFYADEVNILS